MSKVQALTCPQCGKSIDADSKFCQHCATQIPQPKLDEPKSSESKEVTSIRKRYTDAYRVARVITTLGDTIKILGLIGGVIIGFIIFGLLAEAGGRTREAPVLAVAGAVLGVIFGGGVGIFCFIWGVIISAQGQILKASVDSSVNNSPFLTNEVRAEIMSL